MKTKTLIAQIYCDFDALTGTVSYTNHSDLMTKVNDYLYENYPEMDIDEDVKVTFENTCFWWNTSIAHYCFAEGAITERQAFNAMQKGGKV